MKRNPIPEYYNFSRYKRVVPRDLFNEAKLLKCLGKISVSILDNKLHGLKEVHENSSEGFEILQNEDGDIMCNNYYILKDNKLIYLFTKLNSRLNWPLCTMNDDGDVIYCFEDDGSFTQEFLDYLEQ